MIRVNSADEALCMWWKRKARDETPSALDPFVMKGHVAARSCPACGGRDHAETESKQASEEEQRAGWRRVGWLDRCKHCGRPWDLLSRFIVKGRIQTSRIAGAVEARALESVDLDRIIDELPRPDVLLYALCLVTDDSSEAGRAALERAIGFRPAPAVRSFEFVAEVASRLALELTYEAPEIWATPPEGFTPEAVRRAVRRCRQQLGDQLLEVGAMARTVPVLLRSGAPALLCSGEPLELQAYEPLPARVRIPHNRARWLLTQDLEQLEQLAAAGDAVTIALELTSIREPHKRRRPAYLEVTP